MVQFRLKALNQLQKPDDLDLLMKVTKRRGWLALGVLGIATMSLVGWSFAGRLPIEVEAPGILTVANGVSRIESTIAGQVVEVHVASGAAVKPGEVIADVATPDGARQQITAPFAGIVTGVLIDAGNVVQVGTPLYLLARADGTELPLVAYVFAPSGKGHTLAPGMEVHLDVSAAPAAAFGVLEGTVSHVEPFPASEPEVYELLGDEQLAKRFTEDGPPVIVTVALTADPATVSGYRWSSRSGPPFPLGAGLDVEATIIQGEQQPIDLVFGR